MKAVLMSIQPKWIEKIIKGEMRTVVEKTKPKKEAPFKCYIYCTKNRDNEIYKCYKVDDIKSGKVIGEFVCDKIDEINPCYEFYSDGYDIDDDMLAETCLTRTKLYSYGGGKTLYGWHISNLKIYDKPKELNEFTPLCKFRNDLCEACCFYEKTFGGCCRVFKSAPKSWYYVEKNEEE